MQSRILPALIGIIIISGAFGVAKWDQSKTETPSAASTQVVGNDSDVEYAPAEVAAHNTADDCWAIINGGVYDLTSWIPQHPGGERAIEGLCGKDGSAAFNGQHGGSAAPEGVLDGFKIGTVK